MKGKVQAFSDLLKPELPLAAGICVIAGEIISSGHLPTFAQLLLGFLTGFFISGTAMITNDYFDLSVDKINHPDRPLPSGRITVFELILVAGLFSFAGFLAAALLNLTMLIVALVIWTIGLLYNWRIKETGLLGNMVVAFSVASTFVFGGLVVGGLFNGIVWTFGSLAFLFDLGEEIAGGAMDIEGDKQRHARSLAILKGRNFALRVSGLLFAAFVSLSFLPFLVGWLGNLYFALVTASDLGVVYFTFRLLTSQTPQEGRKRIRELYLTLTIAVIAIVISRLI
ncbi:MAG: UbiA family prenyltransferase [Candidatus Bathyarchaeia archaeon]|jgi:geranylgeranylglycerol-phosphate geranylgeranyltransferase